MKTADLISLLNVKTNDSYDSVTKKYQDLLKKQTADEKNNTTGKSAVTVAELETAWTTIDTEEKYLPHKPKLGSLTKERTAPSNRRVPTIRKTQTAKKNEQEQPDSSAATAKKEVKKEVKQDSPKVTETRARAGSVGSKTTSAKFDPKNKLGNEANAPTATGRARAASVGEKSISKPIGLKQKPNAGQSKADKVSASVRERSSSVGSKPSKTFDPKNKLKTDSSKPAIKPIAGRARSGSVGAKPSDLPLDKSKKYIKKSEKVQIDERLLTQLAKDAFSKYSQYHNRNNLSKKEIEANQKNPTLNRGQGPGFFSRVRHTQKGFTRAENLIENLSRQDFSGSLEEISRFFRDSKTAYHHHSYAAYLADELANHGLVNHHMQKRYQQDSVVREFGNSITVLQEGSETKLYAKV